MILLLNKLQFRERAILCVMYISELSETQL